MIELRRILVPIDFSERSLAALSYALRLAGPRTTIVMLHIAEPPRDLVVGAESPLYLLPSIELGGAMGARARADLDALAARFERAGGPHLEACVDIGDAAERIAAVAASQRVDLVVLGTHGRTGIARALLGSIAEEVVRRSTVPVLTLRAHGAASALAS